jgi:beta-galactosidase
MTNNGLVLPDLTWKPVAYELKQAYSPVAIYPAKINHWHVDIRTDRYIVKNKSFTRSLSDYIITAHLREDGKIVHSYIIDADGAAPLSDAYITVKPDYNFNDKCEYMLDFSVALKEPAFYADAGYEVGCFQYFYRAAMFAGAQSARMQTQNIPQDLLPVLYDCKPCLDRGLTGMDWGWSNIYAPLRNGNTKITGNKIISNVDGREVESYVEMRYNLINGSVLEIDAAFNINPALKYIPRAGLEFVLPAGFEKLVYYGYGENENYSDRMMSAKLGVFESTVTAQHFPFVPPSETGGHEQTRWLMLEDDNGRKLKFESEQPFHFSALHNSIEDYQNAKHEHELPKRAETYLHIAARHSGIGSNMGWSSDYAPEHLLAAGVYRLRFSISLL